LWIITQHFYSLLSDPFLQRRRDYHHNATDDKEGREGGKEVEEAGASLDLLAINVVCKKI
jgi:hypothetical protein